MKFQLHVISNFEFMVHIPNHTIIWIEYLYHKPLQATKYQQRFATLQNEALGFSLKKTHANVRGRSIATHIGQHKIIVKDLNDFIESIEAAALY